LEESEKGTGMLIKTFEEDNVIRKSGRNYRNSNEKFRDARGKRPPGSKKRGAQQVERKEQGERTLHKAGPCKAKKDGQRCRSRAHGGEDRYDPNLGGKKKETRFLAGRQKVRGRSKTQGRPCTRGGKEVQGKRGDGEMISPDLIRMP